MSKDLVYAFIVRMTKCLEIKPFNLGKKYINTYICTIHHSIAK